MVILYTLVKLNKNSIRFIFYVACNVHNGVFFTSCKCVNSQQKVVDYSCSSL